MQTFYIACAFIVVTFILGATAKHVHKHPVVKTIHQGASFGIWAGLIWAIGFVNTLMFLGCAIGLAIGVLIALLRFGNQELRASIKQTIVDNWTIVMNKK